MKVISDDFETINKASIVEFLTQIRNSYNLAKNINIILDGSGYHRSNEVKNFCKENNITVHFLPPYSPNLNPIERLWKVMNERTRNNQFFASAKEFKEKKLDIFLVILFLRFLMNLGAGLLIILEL